MQATPAQSLNGGKRECVMSYKKITLEDVDKRLRQGVSIIDITDILDRMSDKRVALRLMRENPELFDDIMRRIDEALDTD